MAGSTYSSNLKIELMTTGENSGTWGDITNTNLGTAFEQAVIGYGNVDYVADANLTISITNSNSAQPARALVLNVTSVFGSLTATRELVVPTIQKQYIVQNNTAGGQGIVVKTSAGTGITVPNGRKAHLYVDGTNVIQMFDFVDINGGTIDGTPIGGSSAAAGAFTTLNASGATTLDGAVALGNASGDLITVPGTINSNLLFTDNSFDIGASGATRPRNLFLAGAATIGGNLSVGGTLTLTGGLTLNGNVTVGDSAADTLTINSTVTSNLIFTDNTYDIGASGATRPRNLFLAGNATVGGAQTLTGALTVDSTTDSSSTTTGSIQTDGGLGVAKALFVGTTANIAGAVTLGSLTATRVPYASTGGLLVDSANMVFNGTRLTVADLADSGLTSGRVTYASSGGALVDSANLLFDGTTLTANALTVTNAVTLSGGTANGVAYLNGSKVLTTGSALTFDGATFTVGAGAQTGYRLQSYVSSGNDGISILNGSNGAGDFAALSFVQAGSQKGVIYTNGGNLTMNSGVGATVFQIGSVEQMRLTSTGLGIGTSSPQAPFGGRALQLGNTGDGRSVLTLQSSSTGRNSIYFSDGATGGDAYAGYIDYVHSRDAMEFGTSATERMQIDSSGNLLIGTTTARNRLTVQGTVVSTPTLGTASGQAFFGEASGYGTMIGTSGFGYGWIQQQRVDGTAQSYALLLQPVGGYVGIGTDAPFSKLMVAGSAGNGNAITSLDNSSTDFVRMFADATFGSAINWSSGDALRFAISDSSFGGFTELARFTGGGEFAIGKTQASESVGTGTGYGFASPSSDPFFSVVNATAGAVNACIYLNRRNTAASNFLMSFYTNDGTSQSGVGSITHNGTSTAYNTSSDYRLKHDIEPMTGAIAKVVQLKPVTYKWNADGSSGEGFIAHELAEAMPHAVSGEKDAVNKDGSIKPQGIDTSFLIATLTAAIQEQQVMIDQLKAEMAALKGA
jgi:hypothetical protein